MIRSKTGLVAGVLVLVLLLFVRARAVEVEGSAALQNDRAAARNQAVADGKQQALRAYAAGRVPPGIAADKAKAIEQVIQGQESGALSYEVLSERVEAGRLVLSLRVELDETRLDQALKAAGIIPARALPRLLIVVTGARPEGKIKSAWDDPPGQRGQLNTCEAAVARAFTRYGFPVIEPDQSTAAVATDKVASPGGEEEKKLIFQMLARDHQAGALVVGRVQISAANPPAAAGITLDLAAANVEKGRTIWSRRFEKEAAAAVAGVEPVLDEVCESAGREALESLYREWTPQYLPGQSRELAVVVKGIGSYAVMKELENRLRQEAPGVKAVSLDRMGPGEVEFKVTTASEPQALGDWLAGNVFGGLRLQTDEVKETEIKASVKE